LAAKKIFYGKVYLIISNKEKWGKSDVLKGQKIMVEIIPILIFLRNFMLGIYTVILLGVDDQIV